MQYRNTKTGAVVEVHSEVKGNWERIDAPSPDTTTKTTTKTATKKPTKKKGE